MEKYYLGEEFVKKVFSRIDGVNINNRESNIKDNGPDLIFELDGNQYWGEVKTRFVPNLIQNHAKYFSERIRMNNVSGIYIILDRVDDRYKKIIKDLYNISILDISNILYLINNDKELKNELNSIINFSLNNIVPQEPMVRLIPLTQLEFFNQQIIEDSNFIIQLQQIKAGRKYAKKYEALLERIIKDIFSNELTLFESQHRTEDGINIFDMICKIKNDLNDDFFDTLKTFFKTKYILFEFKNYNENIKQGQICTTEKYLFETALRKVAIIITRHGIDENGMKLVEGILRESGKLMIILNDEDVIEMINLRERGEQASQVLSSKLDEILTKLEK